MIKSVGADETDGCAQVCMLGWQCWEVVGKRPQRAGHYRERVFVVGVQHIRGGRARRRRDESGFDWCVKG